MYLNTKTQNRNHVLIYVILTCIAIFNGSCSRDKHENIHEKRPAIIAEQGKVVYFEDAIDIYPKQGHTIKNILERLYKQCIELLPLHDDRLIYKSDFNNTSEQSILCPEQNRIVIKNNVYYLSPNSHISFNKLSVDGPAVLLLRIKSLGPTRMELVGEKKSNNISFFLPPSNNFQKVVIPIQNFRNIKKLKNLFFGDSGARNVIIDYIALYRPASSQDFTQALQILKCIQYFSKRNETIINNNGTQYTQVGWPEPALWLVKDNSIMQKGIIHSTAITKASFEVMPKKRTTLAFRCAPIFALNPGKVFFEIVLENEQDKIILFSKSLNIGPESLPNSTNKLPPLEFVDLNPYAGKKIKLTFKTRFSKEGNNFSLATWIAPILVSRKKAGSSSAFASAFLCIADSLRADAISPDTRVTVDLPGIDYLRNRGVTFTNFSSAANNTTASTLVLLNSKRFQSIFPEALPLKDIFNQNKNSFLPVWQDKGNPEMLDILRQAGYMTICITANPYLPKGLDRCMYLTTYERNILSSDTLFNKTKNLIDQWADFDIPFLFYIHAMDTHSPHMLWEQQLKDGYASMKDSITAYEIPLNKTIKTDHVRINSSDFINKSTIVMTSTNGSPTQAIIPLKKKSWYSPGFTLRIVFNIPTICELPISQIGVFFFEQAGEISRMFYNVSFKHLPGNNEVFINNFTTGGDGQPSWDNISNFRIQLISDYQKNATIEVKSVEIIKGLQEKIISANAPKAMFQKSFNTSFNPDVRTPDYDNASLNWDKACYAAKIVYFDKNLYQFLLQLKERNFTPANSFFIFTADHGEQFMEHGAYGHGASLFQEETRVPGIFVYSPIFDPGTVRNVDAGSINILPTIANIANIKIPETIEGRSILNIDEQSISISETQYSSMVAFRHAGTLLLKNYLTGTKSWYSYNDFIETAVNKNSLPKNIHARILYRADSYDLNKKENLTPVNTREEGRSPDNIPDPDIERLKTLGYMN